MAIFLHFLLDLKHFIETSRHDTVHFVSWACHSISLTRTSLPICKYTYINTINCTLYKHFCVFEYLFLACFGAEASIKHELFFYILALNTTLTLFVQLLIFFNPDLKSELINDGHSIHAVPCYLRLVHRSNTTVDSNLAFHVFNDIMEFLPLHCLHLVLEPQPLILFSHILILVLKC
jgi:hypothetical protein